MSKHMRNWYIHQEDGNRRIRILPMNKLSIIPAVLLFVMVSITAAQVAPEKPKPSYMISTDVYKSDGTFSLFTTGNETRWIAKIEIQGRNFKVLTRSESERTYEECLKYKNEECLEWKLIVYPIPSTLAVVETGIAKPSLSPSIDVAGKTYFSYDMPTAVKYAKLGSNSIIIIENYISTADMVNTTSDGNMTHLNVSNPYILLYMNFDYNWTSVSLDMTNNSFDGTYNNQAKMTDKNTYKGNSTQFRGASFHDTVSIASTSALNLYKYNFTISLWFNTTDNTTGGQMITGRFTPGATFRGWRMYFAPAQHSVVFNLFNDEGNFLVNTNGSAQQVDITNTRWHHVAVKREKTSMEDSEYKCSGTFYSTLTGDQMDFYENLVPSCVPTTGESGWNVTFTSGAESGNEYAITQAYPGACWNPYQCFDISPTLAIGAADGDTFDVNYINPPTQNMSIYVDGIYQASTSGVMVNDDYASALYLGWDRTIYNYAELGGNVDEFMVINRSLSEGEIQSIYAGTYPRFYPSGTVGLVQNTSEANFTLLNITGKNLSINGSSIYLSAGHYDGSWHQTPSQPFTGNNSYAVNYATTNVSLNYTLASGSTGFYSPMLLGNNVLTLYTGETCLYSGSGDWTIITQCNVTNVDYTVTGDIIILNNSYVRMWDSNLSIDFDLHQIECRGNYPTDCFMYNDTVSC